MREFPRQRATDNLIIKDEKADPVDSPVEAAHTAENCLSQERERASQTPMVVTDNGINLEERSKGSRQFELSISFQPRNILSIIVTNLKFYINSLKG